MTVSALNAAIGRINDVLCASSVLVWDSRTMLPKGGAETRAGQLAPSEFQKRFDTLQQQWDALEKQLQALSPPPRKP